MSHKTEIEQRYWWFLGLGYDPIRAWDGAFEEWYYHEHGELPEGHYVIERVEIINGSRLFIHSDPTGKTYS